MQDVSPIEKVVLVVKGYGCDSVAASKHSFGHVFALKQYLIPALEEGFVDIYLQGYTSSIDDEIVFYFLPYHEQSFLLDRFIDIFLPSGHDV